MIDEISIHSDENRPIRVRYAVTHQRAGHYSDVIESMTQAAVQRFITKHGRCPSEEQVTFYQKELVRYLIIRRDVATAQDVQINGSNLLLETALEIL